MQIESKFLFSFMRSIYEKMYKVCKFSILTKMHIFIEYKERHETKIGICYRFLIKGLCRLFRSIRISHEGLEFTKNVFQRKLFDSIVRLVTSCKLLLRRCGKAGKILRTNFISFTRNHISFLVHWSIRPHENVSVYVRGRTIDSTIAISR
jgi:hypothetical protein